MNWCAAITIFYNENVNDNGRYRYKARKKGICCFLFVSENIQNREKTWNLKNIRTFTVLRWMVNGTIKQFKSSCIKYSRAKHGEEYKRRRTRWTLIHLVAQSFSVLSFSVLAPFHFTFDWWRLHPTQHCSWPFSFITDTDAFGSMPVNVLSFSILYPIYRNFLFIRHN